MAMTVCVMTNQPAQWRNDQPMLATNGYMAQWPMTNIGSHDVMTNDQ